MSDPTAHKRKTADSFSHGATAYVDSDVHRHGDDLEQLATWTETADLVLDIATGAGHTAGAVAEKAEATVIAADVAPDMVRTSVDSFDGLVGVLADAERLPFRSGVFDAVTCRIAAHHFPDPKTFLEETARVLKPGGSFAFEDNIAPEDPELDSFLNRVERLRDPTHVRSHTESEWLEWLAAVGLTCEEAAVIEKTIEYESWIEQLETPAENRAELQTLLTDAPPEAVELFSIRTEDGIPISFTNYKLLCLAKN